MALKKGERQYHIFTSTNLLAWNNENHSITNSYECPDFFQLPVDGDRNRMKWVLVRGDGKYSIGDFNGSQFLEETAQFDSDSGPNFYATQTWENAPAGRRVQSAWMRGGKYPDMPFNQQITFPRELTLRTTRRGPRLFREPVRELATLHGRTESWTNRTLRARETLRLSPGGQLFRIRAQLSIEERATLTLNLRGAKLVLEHDSASCDNKAVPLIDALSTVEILVDRTSLEMFANGGEVSFSKCFLPTENGLHAQATGGRVLIKSLELVHLRSAWPVTAP